MPAKSEPAPPMAAQGLPLELSLEAVAAPAAAAEPAVQRSRRRDRAMHYNRQRRRRVAALYAELRAMLPAISSTTRRVPREEILEAASARVKELEGTAATLEEACRAAPRPGRDVAVCRGTVTVSVRLPAPAPEPPAGALMRRVLEAFERRGARVLVATMARRAGDAVVTVTASAAAPEVVEMIRTDIVRIN